MNKPFSLYLDLVRFMAAVLVVVAHYLHHGIVGGNVAMLMPDLGREAVIVFFVLSGFVIAYTTEQKKQSFRQYLVARMARIYSVALPILLLTLICAAIVTHFFGVHVDNGYVIDKAYVYLPFHLMFLGELWALSETPPWLAQYWSLGYEVWYYVLFAAAYYTRGCSRIIVTLMVFLLLGPKLWLLLPVWMTGVWIYHWQKEHAIRPTMARIGWCFSMLALAAYKTSGVEVYLRTLGNDIWPFQALHLGSADRFLSDYVVSVVIAASFLFARFADFKSLEFFSMPIRRCSAYTFTLYLVHGLIMGVWGAFYHHDANSVGDIAAITVLIAVATIVMGHFTEGKKDAFQRFFQRILDAPALSTKEVQT